MFRMDEFSFIDSIRQPSYCQAGLVKGIGDDAAVIRHAYQDLVTAVDTVVESVHFLRKTMDPYHIGYKALASNISDLAAMGAQPAYYLVSLVRSPEWTDDEIQEIFIGMKELARAHQMDLIGGDTVSGSVLMLSVTVIGLVEPGKARYRSDAREGDVVFVTGTLGDSQAGLHLLLHDEADPDGSVFIDRHQMPSPRAAFALKLRPLSRVALNDISDGISSEANEIADSSGVDLYLEEKQIPVHTGLQRFPRELQEQWVLAGGEDYELIGTVSPAEWPLVRQAAADLQLKVTQIGHVAAKQQEQGAVYIRKQGAYELLEKKGYNHFK